MKRFLFGISALLLTTAMGFAQPTVRPATYSGDNSPRLERASWWGHRNKHDKKRYKAHHRNRRNDRRDRDRRDRRDDYRDHHRDRDRDRDDRRDNYKYRPYRGY
jgi:hypothetical protein